MTYSYRKNIFKKVYLEILKMYNLIDGLKNRMYIFQDQISKLEDFAEYFLAGYSAKNKKRESMKEK